MLDINTATAAHAPVKHDAILTDESEFHLLKSISSGVNWRRRLHCMSLYRIIAAVPSVISARAISRPVMLLQFHFAFRRMSKAIV
jgi:hypothetical protein